MVCLKRILTIFSSSYNITWSYYNECYGESTYINEVLMRNYLTLSLTLLNPIPNPVYHTSLVITHKVARWVCAGGVYIIQALS